MFFFFILIFNLHASCFIKSFFIKIKRKVSTSILNEKNNDMSLINFSIWLANKYFNEKLGKLNFFRGLKKKELKLNDQFKKCKLTLSGSVVYFYSITIY